MKDPPELVRFFKYEFAIAILSPAAATLPRLAIVALYLRIFKVSQYRIAAYSVAGLMILAWVGLNITHLAMCTPVQFNWNKNIPGGHCINQEAFFRWSSLPNMVEDLALLVMPIPVVWRLQMSTITKIGVIFTFALGSM